MTRQHLTTLVFLALAQVACIASALAIPTPTATALPVSTTTPVFDSQKPLDATQTPTATTYTICNTDALNLRALPGEEFQKIGELTRGAAVFVYLDGVRASDGGQWSFVLVDGVGFWVNAKYICEAK